MRPLSRINYNLNHFFLFAIDSPKLDQDDPYYTSLSYIDPVSDLASIAHVLTDDGVAYTAVFAGNDVVSKEHVVYRLQLLEENDPPGRIWYQLFKRPDNQCSTVVKSVKFSSRAAATSKFNEIRSSLTNQAQGKVTHVSVYTRSSWSSSHAQPPLGGATL